jgi:hypothetical protein
MPTASASAGSNQGLIATARDRTQVSGVPHTRHAFFFACLHQPYLNEFQTSSAPKNQRFGSNWLAR